MTRTKRIIVRFVGTAASVLALGASPAWAESKVTITREDSAPKRVEIKAGEEVRWVNASGGTAHISFRGSDGVQFYLGQGGSRTRFAIPGTYEYTVHISGTKGHQHTGAVVVK